MNSPFILIIFGATGDLAHKKLLPALYHLYREKLIASDIHIVGVGRRAYTSQEFASEMSDAVKAAQKTQTLPEWVPFAKQMHYVQGLFEDDALYKQLVDLLQSFDDEAHACIPRFFYLATPPVHYQDILTRLEKSKLSDGCGQGTANYTRILIEKPFGKDLETAEALEKKLSSAFEERQIYRIDHYLGKETVQNVLAFRFGNGMFEPTWNHEFIDHVQITLSEDIGVGTRGQFYEGVGALRDVVQNHMLQMLALVAMEQPKGFNSISVRQARVKAMKAVRCMDTVGVKANVVRGQYEGYKGEKGVDSRSLTETFVALKAYIDTPRWKGVPFYLRTGKNLGKKVTEISLHFKKPVCPDDMCLFNPDLVHRNVLTLKIQPDEGIVLRLMVKKPGFGMDLTVTQMEFNYKHVFGTSNHEAYERLFLDAIRGDQTLFASTDEIKASWEFMMSILEVWKKGIPALTSYKKGTWGPPAATDLIEKDGRHWFLSEK